MIATALVVYLAPEAGGSGIPQVLDALEHAQNSPENVMNSPLVSIRTALIKIVSSACGVFGGASIGREGPTVQIASSVFTWVGKKTKIYTLYSDFESFLIAGSAAGVAAAFNTPLAGIAFAIEEIAENSFKHFKRFVMLSVIIGGITAQAIVGDYLYFGHLQDRHSNWLIVPEALLIGILGGISGGVFGFLLAKPGKVFSKIQWWKKALICGLICAAFNFLSEGHTSGSSYEITQDFINLKRETLPHFFALEKAITTLASFQSGMAGGIFSPCLSIGAGLGSIIGNFSFFGNLRVCALIGMVAFFSATVQAPLTAVIIVTEMTDEHILILPFMIAAFIAHGVGHRVMPIPLYKYLAFGKKQID